MDLAERNKTQAFRDKANAKNSQRQDAETRYDRAKDAYEAARTRYNTAKMKLEAITKGEAYGKRPTAEVEELIQKAPNAWKDLPSEPVNVRGVTHMTDIDHRLTKFLEAVVNIHIHAVSNQQYIPEIVEKFENVDMFDPLFWRDRYGTLHERTNPNIGTLVQYMWRLLQFSLKCIIDKSDRARDELTGQALWTMKEYAARYIINRGDRCHPGVMNTIMYLTDGGESLNKSYMTDAYEWREYVGDGDEEGKVTVWEIAHAMNEYCKDHALTQGAKSSRKPVTRRRRSSRRRRSGRKVVQHRRVSQ